MDVGRLDRFQAYLRIRVDGTKSLAGKMDVKTKRCPRQAISSRLMP